MMTVKKTVCNMRNLLLFSISHILGTSLIYRKEVGSIKFVYNLNGLILILWTKTQTEWV